MRNATTAASVPDIDANALSFPERVIASLLYRFNYGVYRPFRNWWDRFYVDRYNPKIMPAVLAIRRKAGVSKQDHPQQGAEFLRLLEKLKPKKIFELGSGQSSPFFAAYAEKHGAEYTSFEQLADWGRLSQEACEEIGAKNPIHVCKTRKVGEKGLRYDRDIAPDAEFVYLDGPTVRLEKPGVKGIKMDAFEHLERGGRPLAILFEGGTHSVDKLLSHPDVGAYDFYPEFIHAWRKGHWLKALRFRRHSIFILKNRG